MPKFLIERNIPNAAELSHDQLIAIARKSRSVLHDLGPTIQWVQSYVTANRITCVYIAPDEEMIREHARRGGFPCDNIMRIVAVIDITTADGALYATHATADAAA